MNCKPLLYFGVPMRIAIIGPAHPYKGGIAQHTTELAHRLTAAGHEVEIISWRTQYPFFYPGQQFVQEPELPEHPGTRRVLSWRNPVGWGKWGRRLRSFDRIVFVWWVPTIQGPVYWGMLRALGKKRPPAVIICHNVLPHEPRPGDRRLARAVLGRCEQIIVHSEAQAKLAGGLVGTPVTTVELPLPLLKSIKKTSKKAVSRELLFFGFVRPYKGVDVLLQALAAVPDVHLTIAGEIWGDPKNYTDLIDKLGLQDRVTLHNGYVPANKLAALVAQADAVVLPYTSGTASWNVSMAHAYGTPVIATSVGSLGTQVRNEVDGLLCEPNNVEALAQAIKHFYEPEVAKRLQQAVPEVPTEASWQRYVQAVTGD
jgi:glycosyltransferase involved in cell wall biosynthesis